MSLIHEALKKAEAQRRLGEPPTLGSPFAPTRRRQQLLPLLIGAIAVAAGAGWWLVRTPAEPAATTAAPPKSEVSAPMASAPIAGAKAEPARSTAAERLPSAKPGASVASNPALPRRTAEAKPETPEQRVQRESAPHPPGSKLPASMLRMGEQPVEMMRDSTVGAAARTATPNAAEKPLRMPADAAAQDSNKPANAATTAGANTAMAETMKPPTSSTATGPPHATPNMPAPATVAKTDPAPPAAPPPAPKSADDVPFFWQLPYNVRKDLPPFALTMHVFSGDPKSRFVILNGNRQIEGDALGADVNLREIRPDGVVLEFHGQRFLVPRVGS